MSLSHKIIALVFACLLAADVCYQCIRYVKPIFSYLECSSGNGGNASGLGYNVLEEELYHPVGADWPALTMIPIDFILVLFSDLKDFISLSSLDSPEIPPEYKV
jgi:hypothetical protein